MPPVTFTLHSDPRATARPPGDSCVRPEPCLSRPSGRAGQETHLRRGHSKARRCHPLPRETLSPDRGRCPVRVRPRPLSATHESGHYVGLSQLPARLSHTKAPAAKPLRCPTLLGRLSPCGGERRQEKKPKEARSCSASAPGRGPHGCARSQSQGWGDGGGPGCSGAWPGVFPRTLIFSRKGTGEPSSAGVRGHLLH